MKIFLDDLRTAPDGWEVARDYNDMIRLLTANRNNISEISLDYDLDNVRNGLNVCEWIVTNNCWPKKIIIHSSHRTGVKYMKELLKKNKPEDTELILSPRL